MDFPSAIHEIESSPSAVQKIFGSGGKQNVLPKIYNIWMSSFQNFVAVNIAYLLRFQGKRTRESANFLNIFYKDVFPKNFFLNVPKLLFL